MEKFIKKIPLPMAALVLALLALGNLLASYGQGPRLVLASLGAILYILLVFKLLFFREEVKKELENPLVMTVLPAFSMATILLAGYIKPFHELSGKIIWYLGIFLHIFFILKFSGRLLLDFDLKKVFPSWFVMYVGIAIVGVTAPGFGQEKLGQLSFYFGILAYIPIVLLLIKRLKNYEMPDPAKPSFAILAAPVSLCLAAYMASFESKSLGLVYLLLVLSQLTYFLVLSRLAKLLKLGFTPSFAGLTFPLVITALSLKLTNKFLVGAGKNLGFLGYLVKFEELLALVISLLVLVLYLKFLLVEKEK